MKNWEVEAILKFYKDIDLDIKVTGEWLERYESVYDTTGAINYDGIRHNLQEDIRRFETIGSVEKP